GMAVGAARFGLARHARLPRCDAARGDAAAVADRRRGGVPWRGARRAPAAGGGDAARAGGERPAGALRAVVRARPRGGRAVGGRCRSGTRGGGVPWIGRGTRGGAVKLAELVAGLEGVEVRGAAAPDVSGL